MKALNDIKAIKNENLHKSKCLNEKNLNPNTKIESKELNVKENNK